MIRRPPRSTLFPYTRSSDLTHFPSSFAISSARAARARRLRASSARSEEHTSELQSHSDLVCRLLLEKKKKKTQLDLECQRQSTENSEARTDHRRTHDRPVW